MTRAIAPPQLEPSRTAGARGIRHYIVDGVNKPAPVHEQNRILWRNMGQSEYHLHAFLAIGTDTKDTYTHEVCTNVPLYSTYPRV